MPEENSKRLICPECQHNNRPGIIFCEECGHQLITELKPTGPNQPVSPGMMAKILAIEENETETVDVHNVESTFRPGTPIFEEKMVLRLEVKGSNEHVLLRLEQGKAAVLGRRDPDDNYTPDVDLMPYGGYRAGISRRHAELTLSGTRIFLRDMGSSNGTYLNNIRLGSEEGHQLRDNDQVRLGSMVLLVGFQTLMES